MARASRSKRALNGPRLALMATNRLRRVSRAFQTSPMPPAPRADKISYGPSRVPGVRTMEVAGIIECRVLPDAVGFGKSLEVLHDFTAPRTPYCRCESWTATVGAKHHPRAGPGDGRAALSPALSRAAATRVSRLSSSRRLPGDRNDRASHCRGCTARADRARQHAESPAALARTASGQTAAHRTAFCRMGDRDPP